MLYIKSYFKKELQQTNTENNMGRLKKIAYALFLGLFSFAVYFLLQTMTKTVLSDAFPHIMQASYFSTLYVYNLVAFAGFMLYFIVNYDAMSFAEIRKNHWYMLIKMGYKPYPMIFSKIIAMSLSLIFVYTVGFLFIIVLTVFLKIYFYFWLFALFVYCRLLDLMLLSMAFMSISLISQNASTGRYILILAAVAQTALKSLLGYRAIVVNRVAMQDVLVLFDFGKSLYIPIALLLIAVFFAVCPDSGKNSFAKLQSSV